MLQGSLVKVIRRRKHVDDPVAYLRRVMVNQHISVWHRYRAREARSSYATGLPVRPSAWPVETPLGIAQHQRSVLGLFRTAWGHVDSCPVPGCWYWPAASCPGGWCGFEA
ncbi:MULTISPECIES: hypothetical protein [unclassified Micromonospora]|uniref:hypothetical protein n=1 Tax=unclassified Micromonospora TaxID=2617518 RepID=UPI002FF23767